MKQENVPRDKDDTKQKKSIIILTHDSQTDL